MRESEVQSTNAKTRVLFGFPRKNVRDLLLPIISGETRTIQQLQVHGCVGCARLTDAGARGGSSSTARPFWTRTCRR